MSRFFLKTALRYESREKCRDTSMHRRMIRIDTDFHRKNTDSPQEIVACLHGNGITSVTIVVIQENTNLNFRLLVCQNHREQYLHILMPFHVYSLL